MKNVLLLAVAGALSFNLQAQCDDWKWPEDKKTAEEKNVLYNDALRNDNFEAAKEPHRWLLENAPDLHSAIYINGEKIYKGLADAAAEAGNEEAKERYVDSLMLIYDMRIKYCNAEADVVSRKAYSAYRYNIKNVKEMPKILELFDKAYELNGNNLDYYLWLPYMHVITLNAQYVKNLTDDQILERYDKIIEGLESQIAKGTNVDKLEGYKERIDGMIVTIVDFDCAMVKEKLGPKFKANPNDLNLAKKIFRFMLNGKCTDDPLWFEAGKVIQEKEPDYGLAKNLALKCKGNKDFNCAEKYFTQALELTEEPNKKAEIYIQLGSLKTGAAARSQYLKALEADPTFSEAYAAIGYLYYQAFDDCAGKEDIVKDRSVFLAAYDMFQKAGNSKMMESSKEQFPSKEEIFTYNYTAGDEISVGCWIGVTTTIRSRD